MNRVLPLMVMIFALTIFFISERTTLFTGPALANEPTPIHLWAASTPAQTMAELKAEFEELHPQFRVEIQTVSWQSLQEKTLWAVAANSNVPDLIVGSSEWTGGLANNGALEPFDKHLPAEFFSQFYSTALGTYQFPEIDRNRPGWRGAMRQYGIPLDLDMMMVFYRDDLTSPVLTELGMETFPDDWEGFSRLGAALHKTPTGTQPALNLTYLDPEDPVSMRMAFLPSGGGLLFDEDLTHAVFNSPEAVAAFEFFSNLLDNGSAKEWNRVTQGDPIELIKGGRIASNIAGPWFCKVLELQVPEQAGRWRVAPFPKRQANQPSTGLGGSCLVMPYNATNREGAIALAQYMSTEKFAMRYFDRVGSPPPQKAAWRNPVFEEPLPFFGGQQVYKVVREVIEDSRPLQLMPNAEVVKSHLRHAMNIIATKEVSVRVTLDKAVSEANETLTQSLN